MFVAACSERWVVAERVGIELRRIQPGANALRVFDAGMGGCAVLRQDVSPTRTQDGAVEEFSLFRVSLFVSFSRAIPIIQECSPVSLVRYFCFGSMSNIGCSVSSSGIPE